MSFAVDSNNAATVVLSSHHTTPFTFQITALQNLVEDIPGLDSEAEIQAGAGNRQLEQKKSVHNIVAILKRDAYELEEHRILGGERSRLIFVRTVHIKSIRIK